MDYTLHNVGALLGVQLFNLKKKQKHADHGHCRTISYIQLVVIIFETFRLHWHVRSSRNSPFPSVIPWYPYYNVLLRCCSSYMKNVIFFWNMRFHDIVIGEKHAAAHHRCSFVDLNQCSPYSSRSILCKRW